jgi:hypothetical protein
LTGHVFLQTNFKALSDLPHSSAKSCSLLLLLLLQGLLATPPLLVLDVELAATCTAHVASLVAGLVLLLHAAPLCPTAETTLSTSCHI